MSTRTDSAVIPSPVRISLRVRLSSKRAAKLSSEAAAGAAFDIKKPASCPSKGTGFVDQKQKSRVIVGLGFVSPVRPAVPVHAKRRHLLGAHRPRVDRP